MPPPEPFLLPHGARLTVMFLNQDMKRVRTGIENAALLRARVFERRLGIVPEILTANYDAHFGETRAELLRAGLISEQTVFRNLYDHYQELVTGAGGCRRGASSQAEPGNEETRRVSEESSAGQCLADAADYCGGLADASGFHVSPRWRVAPVPGTPDVRVFDHRDELLMYRKCSRQSGVLEYINFFHQGKKWRRDTYATQGVLNRIQYLDPPTSECLCEHYLRTDGSVALIQLYELVDGRRQLRKIAWMHRTGFCLEEFRSQQELIAHWLDWLTDDPERCYVMVSDKNRFYYQALREIKKRGDKPNVFVVPVIHAVHTKNGFDVDHSGANVNYVNILHDIQTPDAIVVGTERQQEDIVRRYGPGNLHVIPHACCEQPLAPVPSFHERQRNKVVYLGRYSEEKQQDSAVRAFARVFQAVPDATLHLYGSGSGKAAIEQLVKEMGLQELVFVNGFTTDPSAAYRSAGLSLLTSRGEGYSLVIMESLSHGCPVVAFDVRYGPSDMIQDGLTGALVPLGDEAALANRIIGILQDPARHQRMCENAACSTQAFGDDIVGERWKRLIGSFPAFAIECRA